MSEIKTLEELETAQAGSYYTIVGAGGDLQEWVDGYEAVMEKEGIGKPKEWFKTTGAAVNHFSGIQYGSRNAFQSDLTILLFPLDGLNMGKLPIFKLRMEDRWFDDIIGNMRGL